MKNECPWTYEILAFADGDLDGEAREAAAMHIRECKECEVLVYALASDAKLLRAATESSARGVDTATIRRALRRRSASRWKGQLAQVAILTLVVGMVGVLSTGPERVDEPALATSETLAALVALNRDLDRLDAMSAAFLAEPRTDEALGPDQAWIEETETAAVLVRAAELLEAECGMPAEAQLRYRLASERFGHTEPGKVARQRFNAAMAID